MSTQIKQILSRAYPEHASLFAQLRTIPTLKPQTTPLPEAVVRVVTGQLLSGKAAETIYQRITQTAQGKGLVGSWQLDYDSFRACGLSGSKARALCRFGEIIGNNPAALEHWRALETETLTREITSHKGMGAWTAAILQLFYLGWEDVFPRGDRGLQRALVALTQAGASQHPHYTFDPDRARPYRSYLALYLWQAGEQGLFASYSLSLPAPTARIATPESETQG